MTRSILLTGAGGQLGRALSEREWPGDVQLVARTRAEMDIGDAAMLASCDLSRFDAVINAAAYTAVDKAEEDIEAAWRGNAIGPALLARACRQAGAALVHISTDYVFDGSASVPLQPGDPVAPRSVYGASKLAGEIAIRSSLADHAIIRTAWVYGAGGRNFVSTMLRLARERAAVSVVDDQVGSPTQAGDLAEAAARTALALIGNDDPRLRGTYHFTNSGAASWAGFAAEIFRLSAERGGPSAQVNRIPTRDYPTPATRPAYSVLDSTALAQAIDFVPRPWEEALAATIDDFIGDYR